MKGKCIKSAGDASTFIVHGKGKPMMGEDYYLEPAKNGTQEQNKAFHALVLEFFKSGQHSYNISSFDDLKNCIKKSLGAGFDSFVYIDIQNNKNRDGKAHYKMFDVKNTNKIPLYIREDPYMKDMIRGKLKSWGRYTKKERTSTIDGLIAEMKEAGVNSEKFEEILRGMGD
jgi:hypothetical protein